MCVLERVGIPGAIPDYKGGHCLPGEVVLIDHIPQFYIAAQVHKIIRRGIAAARDSPLDIGDQDVAIAIGTDQTRPVQCLVRA